jgi:glycerophosphoryl diester phosphodiesterase
MLRRLAALVPALVLLALPAVAPAANPWLEQRVLVQAHQGGEDEFPSNTMYALERAVAAGADMLELDIGSTKDGRIVVLHDNSVDRTTNGTGSIGDLTLAQVQRLDAAYWFVPGRNAVHGLPASSYPLRGVRTGDRRPPRGFKPSDFRIPTLDEVLRAFPRTPINIEIKGRGSDQALFDRNADLLAALLGQTRRRDLIVVSFNQAAIDRFHAQVPAIPLAPGLTGMAGFILGGASPGEGVVAMQVPITFDFGGSLLEITTPDFVARAHEAGYAVHTWLSNDTEDEATYRSLLAMCVDGIMAAKPLELLRLLRREGIAQPGGRGEDPCTSGVARRASAAGGAVALRLLRRGLSPEARAGKVVLRRRGRVLARGRYALAHGAASADATVRLTRTGRAALRRAAAVRATAVTTERGARVRTPVVVRRG